MMPKAKGRLHVDDLRRTRTAAMVSCEKLETELQHDEDILPALTAALKYAERAAIEVRHLCHNLYPVPTLEIKEAIPVPGEAAVTEYGMTITIPRLLPARGKDGGYIRAAIADLFRDRPRTFLRDVVVAVEQQYDKGLPPRRWRDHDNVELTSLLNELSLWVLSGDDPRTMDLFQFATKTAQNCTVIHIIYRSNFPDWVANVWGKNHKIANHNFTPSIPPISPAVTVDFLAGHAPTEGSSTTWN